MTFRRSFYIGVALALILAGPARADSARDQRVKELREKAQKDKARAWLIARQQGWAPKTARTELMAIEGGRVWMRQICDDVAGITVADDLIRAAPYNLSGAGLTVGMWDQALVRTTHQEFVPRVTNVDSGATMQHATSVAGVFASLGFNASAIGMAPQVTLQCYDWNDDLGEVTAHAMSYPGEPDTLPLSNHSYDYVTGWTYPGGPPQWFGVVGAREDSGFGIYDNTARALDVIAYDAPYYLQIKAAGNDRGEPAPPPGTFFFYASGGFGIYNSSTDPKDDGWDNGGYDTIPHEQNAKNILVVGAVSAAVSNGVRDIGMAQMTSFSDWGPTDDGRIKPDVVTDGDTILAASDAGDNAYVYESGTSFSAPGAAGVAALLVQYYGQLFPGQWMRSSMLKGLIIHTADDLGRTGPDYQFGWGLVNAKAAADQIKDHAADRARSDMREGFFTNAVDVQAFPYVRDGTNSIRVTISWTDPPGVANIHNEIIDDPTSVLVHDLDLRIIGPDGATNFPFVLDRLNPTNIATTGDNDLDNVEQVVIAAPAAATGFYRVVIGMEGALATNRQDYALLVSGLKRADEIRSTGFITNGFQQTWHSFSGEVYQVLYSTDAANPSWTPLGGPVTATSESISFTDTNQPAAKKFYRFQ